MNSKLRKGLIALGLGLSVFAVPVEAEEKTGFYGALSIGTMSADEAKGGIGSTSYGNVTGAFDLDSGAAYSAGLGYDFGKWRLEADYTSVSFDVTGVTGCVGSTCLTSTSIDGDKEMEAKSFGLTAFYDFENESKWTPYLGAGVTSTELEGNDFTVTYSGTTGSFVGGTETVTGVKGVAGISYDLGEKSDVYSEITYLETDGFTSKGGSDTIAITYDPLSAWGAKIGLRYRF